LRTICGQSARESLTMRLIRRSSTRVAAMAFAVALAVPFATGVPNELAYARPAPDSFADLAARLLPAVGNISSTPAAVAQRGNPGAGPEIPMFPPGSPFEQFFKDFMNRNRPGGRGDNQPPPDRRMQSLGSGFIIDASGLVVTNNHVIDGADEITVTLQD